MKTRLIAGVAVTAVVSTALTATATSPASAAPEPSIWGSFTTREVTTDPYGSYKDVTVTWNFSQVAYHYNGQIITDAVPTVNSYYKRQVTDYNCYDTYFAGWELTNSPTSSVLFDMPAQNLMTGKSRLQMALTGNGNRAQITTGNCGEDQSDPIPLSLVGKGRGTALIGEEVMDHSSGDVYLSPIEIAMRKSGNAWYSAGSVVRQQTVPSSTSKTVYVSWNIGVRNPSDQCVLPTRKKVRGKKPAAVKKLLKKAGFKGMKIYRSNDRKVRKGRVINLLSMTGSTATCGKKAEVIVSR